MATLPDYTQLGDRPLPTLPRRSPNIATARATSGMEGVAAQEMTQTAAHLDAASRIAFQIQDEHDTLRAEDAFNQLRQRQIDMTYGDSGYMKLQGANAVNQPVLKNYGDEFDKTATDLAGSLDNDFQRKLFEKRAGIAGLDLRQGIVRHVSQQSDVYAQNVLKGTIDTEVNASAADPSITKFSLARIDNSIDNYASRLGLPKEVVDSQKAAAKSHIYSSQIKTALINDPLTAQKYYNLHRDDLSPSDRPILEHAIKAAVLPIEVKAEAQDIMGPKSTAEIKNAASGGAPFPAAGTFAVSNGVAQLEAPDIETATNWAREAEKSGTKVNINIKSGAPQTARDTKAKLGDWIAEAERRYPTDPVKRDALVAQIKGNISNIVAIQNGVALQAHSTLTKLMMPEKGNAPTSLEELTSTPEGRNAWALTSPESQRGFIAWIGQNQKKAEGQSMKSNAAVNEEVFTRINLPDGDQNKIWNPGQLAPYFAKGLTRADYEWHSKLIDEQRTPDGQRLSDVRKNFLTAIKPRFDSSTMIFKDEKGGEDYFKFQQYATQKERETRAAGKDPYSIYNPSSKDYIGNDVPTFQRTLEQKVKDRVDSMGAKPPPKVANDADYSAVPKGAVYLAPDGQLKRKQ